MQPSSLICLLDCDINKYISQIQINFTTKESLQNTDVINNGKNRIIALC
jgi:hypothetical protein